MNKKEHGNFSTRRIVLDAMLIALFFVLLPQACGWGTHSRLRLIRWPV